MNWFLFLVLSGSAPSVDAYEARAIANERRLIAASDRAVSRSGTALTIGRQTLSNSGRCSDDDGQCVEYYADRRWGSYIGVYVRYYESGDYLLVDTESDQRVAVGGRPIASPSGRRFFVGLHDEAAWNSLDGAAVWNLASVPERQRVVDTSLVMFERFIAWHGDDCVAFQGARGYGRKLKPTRSFWLFAQDGDWRLSEQRPPVCR